MSKEIVENRCVYLSRTWDVYKNTSLKIWLLETI